MTTDHAATVDSLAATLVGGADRLGADERAVAVALYRLLAKGRPVAPRDLAHAANLHEDFVRAALSSWSDLHHDADRIVAFWGLDLRPTRFAVGGATLFTCCAWDPLFIAPVLGDVAEVESRCPVTGRAVSLRVGPGGPQAVSPPEAALTFPDRCDGPGSVIGRFCSLVLFFSSWAAARDWADRRPGATVITLADGFELGRRMSSACLGVAVSEAIAGRHGLRATTTDRRFDVSLG